MNPQFILMMNQLTRFLVIIVCGFLMMRFKCLTREDFNSIAKIVIKILLPIFIVTTIPATGKQKDLITALPLMGVAFIVVIILLAIGRATANFFRLPDKMARAHIVCFGISNVGFMGLPLGEAIFGTPGILAASLYAVANDATMWTVGKKIMAGKMVDQTDAKSKDKKFHFRFRREWLQFFNPAITAILIGFTLLALEINPQGNVVWDSLAALGSMAKYLPMVFIGGMLATFNFKDIRKHSTALVIVFFKMILLPVAVYYLTQLVLPGLPVLSRAMLTIDVGLPSTAIGATMAAAYGADEQYAASCITITTLASLLTMPLVLWLIGMG